MRFAAISFVEHEPDWGRHRRHRKAANKFWLQVAHNAWESAHAKTCFHHCIEIGDRVAPADGPRVRHPRRTGASPREHGPGLPAYAPAALRQRSTPVLLSIIVAAVSGPSGHPELSCH
jgi:hypothetical protein